MGSFKTEIALRNEVDIALCKRGYIAEDQIRQVTVDAIVDTRAITLALTEALCRKLGLDIAGERMVRTADGKHPCTVTRPVEVRWKNRETSCEALVIPGLETPLLGAIPLEGMDLIVNPVAQELVGANGNEPILNVY
jgi:clan AA aspartic protease